MLLSTDESPKLYLPFLHSIVVVTASIHILYVTVCSESTFMRGIKLRVYLAEVHLGAVLPTTILSWFCSRRWRRRCGC